ncbi:MAG: hypothetical protein HUK15_00975, partial [Bacteroidales bacterium]|nr:hypothetical protein [Bacteroidales bacterium]
QNLGFPINTPYDDFMYAIETNGKSAFFASDRTTKDGQVMVCRYIIEENPQFVAIDDEEKLQQIAELNETDGAESEYIEIVNKANEEPEQEEVVAEVDDEILPVMGKIDTTDVFAVSRQLLYEKKQSVDKYAENEKILKSYIRELSSSLQTERQKSDKNSAEIVKQSSNIVTFYSLAKKFGTASSRAAASVKRCVEEQKALMQLDTASVQYKSNLQHFCSEVQKINAKSPLTDLLETKNEELSLAKQTRAKLEKQLADAQSVMSDLNVKLETKMHLIITEEDSTLRERYINEHKALENKKIDVVQSIKHNQVEIKRLLRQIENTEFAIESLEELDNMLDTYEFTSAYANDSLLADNESFDKEVSSLQDFVDSENTNIFLAEKQAIEDNESLYSKEIDYETLAYDKSRHYYKPIGSRVASYVEYVSPTTAHAIELVMANDSLISEKSVLEEKFDKAEDDALRANIISEINGIQTEITRNEEELKSYTSRDENSGLVQSVQNFNDLAQKKSDDADWQEIVDNTRDLIVKSTAIQENLDNESDEAVARSAEYVVVMSQIKYDIDNQIVDNVSKLENIISSTTNSKENTGSAKLDSQIAKARNQKKTGENLSVVNSGIELVTKNIERINNSKSVNK